MYSIDLVRYIIKNYPNPEEYISEILETILWSGLFAAKKLVIINIF